MWTKLDSLKIYFPILLLLIVVLYPKFPLLGVGGTFVSVRAEDFVVGLIIILTGWNLLQLKVPTSRAIGLYFVIGLVSLFSAVFLIKTVEIKLGLLHWLRRIEYMSMFFVGFWILSSIKQLNLIIRTLLLVSLLVVFYGLGQHFLGFPVITTTNSEFAKGLALTLGPGARINSTFAGHYDLAAFSLIPLLLCLTMFTSNLRKNWPSLLIFVLVYWVMLLSASRITFAAFFVSASVLLLGLKKWWWNIPLGVLAVVSIFLSPQLSGRYKELIINHFTLAQTVQAVDKNVAVTPDALQTVAEDRSFNIRLKASWPKALRAFYKNPILGTGFSSVGLAVDSDVLRMLAETGVMGFLAFGLIIWRVFKKSFAHPFVWTINCAVLGLLIIALFIDIFEASNIAIVIWLLLCISEKVKILAYEI